MQITNCKFKLEGLILKDRYKVLKYIDEGHQGMVYIVKDLKREISGPLVVKLSKEKEVIAKEIRYMKKIYKFWDKM